MYKITLNSSIPYNHSFYCPDSKILLDSMLNTTLVKELTPAIKRGIFGKTLLSEEIIEDKKKVECKEEVKEEVKEECKEEVKEEKPTKRKSKKNTKK